MQTILVSDETYMRLKYVAEEVGKTIEEVLENITLPLDERDTVDRRIFKFKRYDPELGVIYFPDPGIFDELGITEEDITEAEEEMGLK